MLFFKRRKSIPTLSEYKLARTSLVKYIENAEQFVAKDPVLSQHIISAKEEFSNKTSKFINSEENYNLRIKSFLFWFLFNWRSDKIYSPVINIFNNTQTDTSLLKLGRGLLDHQYSLFLIKGRVKDSVHLKNIFTNFSFFVTDPDTFEGLEEGTWFESRIFKLQEIFVVADYILLHPKRVFEKAKKQIRSFKGDVGLMNKFILELQKYYIRSHSYKKIDVLKIYNFNKN